MNSESILVIGVNSRPIAASAKALGLKVNVIDYWGDQDLRKIANDILVVRDFEDKKEIVYFKTFPELEEKYYYYLKHPEEAERIAQAGYEKVKKYHNADIRAKWFAKIVLHHANGGKYDESFNDLSQYGVQNF